MKRALVIIPTYNEAENIQKIIPRILEEDDCLQVLVVDDNSPDGTAGLVKKIQKQNKRVHIIERRGKMGLGTAYVAGFKYGIQEGFDYILEMDADFSHDPDALPVLLKKAEDHDLVIGSRYFNGVNVVNWPMRRLLLSYFANIYTRIITGIPVHDATGGFKCYKRAVLQSLNLDSIKSNGYSFQIENKFSCMEKGIYHFRSADRICRSPCGCIKDVKAYCP